MGSLRSLAGIPENENVGIGQCAASGLEMQIPVGIGTGTLAGHRCGRRSHLRENSIGHRDIAVRPQDCSLQDLLRQERHQRG